MDYPIYFCSEKLRILYEVADERGLSNINLMWRLGLRGVLTLPKVWMSLSLDEREARDLYRVLGEDTRLEFLVAEEDHKNA